MQLIEMALTMPMFAPPLDGVEEVQPVPVEVKTLPAVPGDTKPVPPFAAGRVPVTPVVRLTFVIVLLDPLIVLFESVAVLVLVKTLVGVMIADKTVIFYSGCVAFCTKSYFVSKSHC